MRKLLIVLAIILIPAISFAGAVTTRYDATIGGYIKAEFGYSDQLRGQSGQLPYREPMPGFKHYGEDYGTYFSSAVQTRINFLVKGPDLKGFKTQAFLEGDFYAPTAQGEFRLRHARIELLGKDVIYTIGQTSQVFGSIYGTSQVLLVTVPWFSAAMPVGGARMPQINAEYTYKKDFKFLVGAFINNSIVGPTGTGDIDSYTMAQPYLHGRIMYTTDKCGRIGRDQLTFMATAFYGREKRVSRKATEFDAPNLENVRARFYDKKIDSWGVHGNLFVPVIPAKKDDKTGSVGFSIFGFTMQNPGDQGIPAPIWTLYAHGRVTVPNSQAPYMRKDGSYGAPVISGWGPQAYVYLTDKLLFSASYANTEAKLSTRYKAAAATRWAVEGRSAYVFILSYDPNPALKFTFDWEREKVKFAGVGLAKSSVRDQDIASTDKLKKRGVNNIYRFGAYYFF